MRFISLYFFIVMFVGCQPLSKEQRVFLRLQQEAIACQKQAMSTPCQQKVEKYLLMARAAQRLQENPQQFGQEILALQMRLAELDRMPITPELLEEKKKLVSNLNRAIELVAIFESP